MGSHDGTTFDPANGGAEVEQWSFTGLVDLSPARYSV
jgi:hypothetical protein